MASAAAAASRHPARTIRCRRGGRGAVALASSRWRAWSIASLVIGLTVRRNCLTAFRSYGSRSSIASLLACVGHRGLAERGAYLRPRPGQPRSHGSQRDGERLGRFLVAELTPGHQQQHVALALRQLCKRLGKRAPLRLGCDSGHDLLVNGLAKRVQTGARKRPVQAHLASPLPGDQGGRDAIQPRAGAATVQVVAVAAAEGSKKRLGHDVVGGAGAQPTGGVVVKLRGVAVKQRGELLGDAQRPADQLGIVGLVHGGFVERDCCHIPAPPWGMGDLLMSAPCGRGMVTHCLPKRRPWFPSVWAITRNGLTARQVHRAALYERIAAQGTDRAWCRYAGLF